MANKISIFLVFLICLVGLIFTYGKWEYLSYKHSSEFSNPIQASIKEGCFLETPIKIKVMKYSDNNATIFMKGKSKSTYLIYFYKLNGQWTLLSEIETGKWILFSESETGKSRLCKFEILNSTMGGSANDFIYWYF